MAVRTHDLARLDQRADQLLEEEGVAAGLLHDQVPELDRQALHPQQVRQQRVGLVRAEGLQRDGPEPAIQPELDILRRPPAWSIVIGAQHAKEEDGLPGRHF